MENRTKESYKYIESTFLGQGDVPVGDRKARELAAGIGQGKIQLSPVEASLLCFLARSVGAKFALEIGTCTGCSALWLAQAVGLQGRVVTIEKNPETARLAAQVFTDSPLGERIDLRVGDALDICKGLLTEGHQFDLVFIDANKSKYLDYAKLASDLMRPGGCLVADNTLSGGAILEEDQKPHAKKMHEFNQWMSNSGQFEATMIPTVEGLTVGIKRGV